MPKARKDPNETATSAAETASAAAEAAAGTGEGFVSGAPAITELEPGHVRMDQASAASIRATSVEASQSAAARVTASSVTMSQGAIGFVRGADVHMDRGAVGAVAAEHAELRDGFAFLVVARRVSGEATVLLEWRGVAAAVAVFLVLGRLLRGRR